MMRRIVQGRMWLLGLGLLLVLAGGFFLLVPRSVEAPDQQETRLNLGRSAAISPIEQVAVKAEVRSQKSEGSGNIGQVQPSPTYPNTVGGSSTPDSSGYPTTVGGSSTPDGSRATAVGGDTSRAKPSPTLGFPTPDPRPLNPDPRSFPVRVEAPAARINAPVVESYLDQNEAIYVPLNEAGHYINSARPGEKGNMVIVGHVRRGLVFNRLVNLKLNDLISIYDEVGKRYDYKVAQIELLPAAGASQEQIQTGLLYTSPTSDERVSLITCYPETSYADRLVVIGVPVKSGEVAR